MDTNEHELLRQLQQLQLQVRTLETRLHSYNEKGERNKAEHNAYYPAPSSPPSRQRRQLLTKPLEESIAHPSPLLDSPYLSEVDRKKPAHHPFLNIHVKPAIKQNEKREEADDPWWRSDIAELGWTRQSMSPYATEEEKEEKPNNKTKEQYMQNYEEQKQDNAASITTDNASTYSYGVERVLNWMDNALHKYNTQKKTKYPSRLLNGVKTAITTTTTHKHSPDHYAFMDTTLRSNDKYKRPMAGYASELDGDRYYAYNPGQHRVHKPRKPRAKDYGRGLPAVDTTLLRYQSTYSRTLLPNPYDMVRLPSPTQTAPPVYSNNNNNNNNKNNNNNHYHNYNQNGYDHLWM
ncbi:hypothetical protein BDF19DRAFT_117842 [Syncephalis fuscata]|nr:hypothetical protein BDF19DRAFT_117842 [Syncephalis fuscata]